MASPASVPVPDRPPRLRSLIASGPRNAVIDYSAYLINTSRAAIVDQDPLLAAPHADAIAAIAATALDA